MDERIIL